MKLLKTIHSDDLVIKVYKSGDGYKVQKQGLDNSEEHYSSIEALLEIYGDDLDENDLK